jgi:ubiquinone/menaquinone biosynthesis C-methylase UbiE
MDNRMALGEMARVLRPGGRLLLKIHAAPYYWRKFRQGLQKRDLLFSIHAIRVLVAGCCYHLLGIQIRKLISNETFQSEWLLRREFSRMDLRIRGYMADSNPLTPSFVIEKTAVKL